MGNSDIEFDFNSILERLEKNAVNDDVIIFDDVSQVPLFSYPYKLQVAVATICLEGEAEGSINLKQYKFSKNDFFVMVPGQIVQFTRLSSDFRGLHIVMSSRFVGNLELNIKDSLLVFLHLKESHTMHLTNESMLELLDFYNILKKAITRVQNPRRLDVVRSLTQAMFYGINDFEVLRQGNTSTKTKKEALFDSFYDLILTHYKESREVGFYAEKLCLTPKYLSTSIKDATGKSAFEWINSYVVLEIKSKLKSTSMTIQQISDELNFPNQSFLGKYFKQHVGVSPSEYRALKM